MAEQFAFLGDKFKAAIAVAMSLGVLLLLPASLGFGRTIVEEAYGQSNLPPLEGEEEGGGGGEEPTLPANASRFLLRGFLGSSLPAQDGDAPIENNNSSHIVAGRFRVFANESLVNRFIAEMDLASNQWSRNQWSSIPQYYH